MRKEKGKQNKKTFFKNEKVDLFAKKKDKQINKKQIRSGLTKVIKRRVLESHRNGNASKENHLQQYERMDCS
jgi:hypothetical protein